MNADQRKYLVERVNKTFNHQKEEIESKLTLKRPSLNNYLIAAFLDSTIQFNDIDILKQKMRDTVLKMGHSDTLIIEDDGGWDYSKRRKNKEKNTVQIIAEDLFVIPESYKKALAEYEAQKKEIEQEVTQLEAQRDTILLKIQVGSNQVLDKLVTQVDNLADLNIMNSQFLLSDVKK